MSNPLEIKKRFLRETIRDCREMGIDIDSEIESVSVEFKTKMAKLKGVTRGIDLISLAYIAIIGSEIYGSFKGIKVDVDIAFVTVTCTAVAGLVGWACGKKS